MTLLERGLSANREAFLGTGLPSTGRRVRHLREAMLRESGIHGNCYCLGKAAIAFGLEPQNCDRGPKKYIHIEPDATWDTDIRSFVDLGALRSSFKGVLRQKQGALENAAVRHFSADSCLPIGALPRDVQGLLRTWLDRLQLQGRALALGWLQRMALRRALAPVNRRLAPRPTPSRNRGPLSDGRARMSGCCMVGFLYDCAGSWFQLSDYSCSRDWCEDC